MISMFEWRAGAREKQRHICKHCRGVSPDDKTWLVVWRGLMILECFHTRRQANVPTISNLPYTQLANNLSPGDLGAHQSQWSSRPFPWEPVVWDSPYWLVRCTITKGQWHVSNLLPVFYFLLLPHFNTNF